MRTYDPASSFDLGSTAWGLGDNPKDFAHYICASHIDLVTADIAYARMEAEYERFMDAQIEAHLNALGI